MVRLAGRHLRAAEAKPLTHAHPASAPSPSRLTSRQHNDLWPEDGGRLPPCRLISAGLLMKVRSGFIPRPEDRHTEPNGSIPVHFAQAGFFQTRTPSGALQPIELSSFQHPYQNGRGSVASEKVGRERRKQGPKWALGPGAVVRTICQEWPQSAGFRPRISGRKKNVPTGRLGGGRGAVVEPSLRDISRT